MLTLRTWTLWVVCALCVGAWASPCAAQIDAGGEVGVRYRGVFLLEGSPDERLANRLESLARLRVGWRDAARGLEAQAQVATGDPRSLSSSWSTMGAWGAAPPVSLERAWAALSPEGLPARLVVGRWAAPWVREGLVWGPDVELPGLLLEVDLIDAGPVWERLRLNPAAAYLSAGLPRLEDEVWLVGGELEGRWRLGTSHLSGSLGYMGVNGARRLGRALARGDARVGLRPAGFTANTTDSDAAVDPESELTRRLVINGLASRFQVLSLWLSWEAPLWEALPLRLSAQGAWNLGARGAGAGEGLAGVLAARLGEGARAGEGALTLRGVWIEADAVLDLFNRELYGTNLKGVGLEGALVVVEGWSLGFEGLLSWRARARLRGLGSGRLEPGGAQGAAWQLHVVTGYVF
jgi:hypothetical protein